MQPTKFRDCQLNIRHLITCLSKLYFPFNTTVNKTKLLTLEYLNFQTMDFIFLKSSLLKRYYVSSILTILTSWQCQTHQTLMQYIVIYHLYPNIGIFEAYCGIDIVYMTGHSKIYSCFCIYDKISQNILLWLCIWYDFPMKYPIWKMLKLII